MADTTRAPTVQVTVQNLDPAQVSIPHDKTYTDGLNAGRRVVSLQIGGYFGQVSLLDDLETVAAVIHRADVLLQARLQMAPAETGVAT